MFRKIGLATVATLCATTVNAQSLPIGIYAYGGGEISYIFNENADATIYGVALFLGYNGSSAGSMLLGFEVSAEYADFDGSEAGPAYSAVVYYESSFGRISGGSPLNALDDYLSAPKSRLSEAYFGETEVLTRSYTGLIPLFEDEMAYGVRFDGTANGINYGVSYHNFDDSNLESLTAGASFERDNYIVSAGAENFIGEGETGLFASVEFDFGLFGTQVFVSRPVIGDGLYYQVEGTYRPFESVELVAGYGSYPDETFSYYYAQAEYSFMNGGYVGAAYTNGDEISSFYNVYAGWRFNYGYGG